MNGAEDISSGQRNNGLYRDNSSSESPYPWDSNAADEMGPPAPVYKRRIVLPIILFLCTCVSVFWAGVTHWNPATSLIDLANTGSLMSVRQQVIANWQMALVYAACLLLILLLHEFGHFLVAVYYRVPASMPYFLPFPLNAIGTFGAVIAMQGMVADRKQIFDIGLAGPLAGLVAAVPLAYLGVSELDLTTAPHGGFGFKLPLLMQWIASAAEVPGYEPGITVWISQFNPVFAAAWVGLLITGMNMFPIGQLDGGHVTYTLFGKAAHVIARASIVIALAFMVYHSSFVFILMIILLLWMGTDHPPTRDDRVPLGPLRWIIGIASLAIPVLCFPPLVLEIV